MKFEYGKEYICIGRNNDNNYYTFTDGANNYATPNELYLTMEQGNCDTQKFIPGLYNIRRNETMICVREDPLVLYGYYIKTDKDETYDDCERSYKYFLGKMFSGFKNSDLIVSFFVRQTLEDIVSKHIFEEPIDDRLVYKETVEAYIKDHFIQDKTVYRHSVNPEEVFMLWHLLIDNQKVADSFSDYVIANIGRDVKSSEIPEIVFEYAGNNIQIGFVYDSNYMTASQLIDWFYRPINIDSINESRGIDITSNILKLFEDAEG